MKKAFLILSTLLILSTSLYSQKRFFPALQTAGEISDVPFAEDKPDTTINYKIIAQLVSRSIDSSEVMDPLDMLARMYNLHIYGGVKPENLDLAAIVFAGGVTAVLTNEAYKSKYGIDNPNTKVISEMKKAGIKIYACGQSINKLKFKKEDINPDVIISVSRLTTITTHQMKGYSLLTLY